MSGRITKQFQINEGSHISQYQELGLSKNKLFSFAQPTFEGSRLETDQTVRFCDEFICLSQLLEIDSELGFSSSLRVNSFDKMAVQQTLKEQGDRLESLTKDRMFKYLGLIEHIDKNCSVSTYQKYLNVKLKRTKAYHEKYKDKMIDKSVSANNYEFIQTHNQQNAINSQRNVQNIHNRQGFSRSRHKSSCETTKINQQNLQHRYYPAQNCSPHSYYPQSSRCQSYQPQYLQYNQNTHENRNLQIQVDLQNYQTEFNSNKYRQSHTKHKIPYRKQKQSLQLNNRAVSHNQSQIFQKIDLKPAHNQSKESSTSRKQGKSSNYTQLVTNQMKHYRKSMKKEGEANKGGSNYSNCQKTKTKYTIARRHNQPIKNQCQQKIEPKKRQIKMSSPSKSKNSRSSSISSIKSARNSGIRHQQIILKTSRQRHPIINNPKISPRNRHLGVTHHYDSINSQLNALQTQKQQIQQEISQIRQSRKIHAEMPDSYRYKPLFPPRVINHNPIQNRNHINDTVQKSQMFRNMIKMLKGNTQQNYRNGK